MDQETTKINSWNEWDALKHVIVGRADGTMVQAPEPGVIRDWPEDGFPRGSYGPLPEEMVHAANEQLDNLARTLERRGIRVDRPELLDFSQPVATPDWSHPTMFGCMPPRDVLITIGNEVLEATMSYRSRWFEYLCYRPLLQRYFNEDPQMRWEAAPKPRLTDASYKPDFWDEFDQLTPEQRLERVQRNDLLLTEEEPLFDAADIVRFGKDLFVQPSMVTNMRGIDWLRRHLPNHRVHAFSFEHEYPLHIDATWVPLRPGLVLHCGERKADSELVAFFHLNDWEIVEAAEPRHATQPLPRLCFCSEWLAMNLLSIDEKTICLEASEETLMEQLSARGFEIVPVPFWDVAPFGGGLHCATVDLYREGTLQDYFPRRYGRF
jgi:glycine amidinotransferase